VTGHERAHTTSHDQHMTGHERFVTGHEPLMAGHENTSDVTSSSSKCSSRDTPWGLAQWAACQLAWQFPWQEPWKLQCCLGRVFSCFWPWWMLLDGEGKKCEDLEELCFSPWPATSRGNSVASHVTGRGNSVTGHVAGRGNSATTLQAHDHGHWHDQL